MKGLINHDDIAKVLISEEQIKQRIAELGAELRKDYADVEGEIVLICILKGAVMFFADLARAMDLNMQMEFMGISSYGNERRTSGIVRITKDIDTSITGKSASAGIPNLHARSAVTNKRSRLCLSTPGMDATASTRVDPS